MFTTERSIFLIKTTFQLSFPEKVNNVTIISGKALEELMKLPSYGLCPKPWRLSR